jgi:RHS repeat-associated protein
MRTLYDGFTFEAVREGVTFRNGTFTTKFSSGVEYQETTGSVGTRYRWLGGEEASGVRTQRIEGDAYTAVTARYAGTGATMYGNGEAVAVSRSAGANTRGGTVYLGKDVLGSVRGVSNEWGQIEERYEYDAFGKPYKGDFTSGVNLGYTGKPYDTVTGLYNYGYRDYQPETARFTTVDPIRDGSNWFAYVNNDPVNWVDLWGLKPGDIFPTVDEAANDFGKEYNGQSIIEKTEYGTTIIPSGDGYTYMEPTKGTKDSITLPTPSDGPDQAVAGHHTHGNYDPEYNNNEFSQTDKETAQQYDKPFYVATPDGSLKVYDPKADKTTTINTGMPSDLNDPGRKNNIDPATKAGKGR